MANSNSNFVDVCPFFGTTTTTLPLLLTTSSSKQSNIVAKRNKNKSPLAKSKGSKNGAGQHDSDLSDELDLDNFVFYLSSNDNLDGLMKLAAVGEHCFE